MNGNAVVDRQYIAEIANNITVSINHSFRRIRASNFNLIIVEAERVYLVQQLTEMLEEAQDLLQMVVPRYNHVNG